MVIFAAFCGIHNAEMTPEEAAPLARRLVKASKLGHLATLMRPLAGPLEDVQGTPTVNCIEIEQFSKRSTL